MGQWWVEMGWGCVATDGEGLAMGGNRLVVVDDSNKTLPFGDRRGKKRSNSLLGGWVNLNENLFSQSSLGESRIFCNVIVFCEEDNPE